MAVIFKLVVLCAIGLSSAQIIDDESNDKTKQKWNDMNSMFIRYGYRMHGNFQLKKYFTSSDGRRMELMVQDEMKNNKQFFHRTSRWKVDEKADAVEIKYMMSVRNSANETLFDIAKAEVESNTCIQFKEIKETREMGCGQEGNVDYFCVYGEEGTCAAEYGQNLTKPALFSISKNCGQRGALHELGHMLGLHHATSRGDRGKYIDVSFKQIGYTNDQFFRRAIFHEYQSCHESSEEQFKLPYDFTSIMHQGILDWSENYELVMTANRPQDLYLIDYVQDFYPHMSHYDKLLLNKIYKCDKIFGKKCGSKTCGTLGYLAKNCTCICPKGTSGETCSSVDSNTDIYDLPSKPKCYKKVDAEDTTFTLKEAGLLILKDLQAPYTQHCVIEVVASDDCKLPMVSIDARHAMVAMQNRINYWFDNDALDCSYFSVFYNVSRTRTRNICWDMLAVKPMYWIFARQKNFWIFARFRDDQIATVAGGITIYFHSTGDYRCDLNGNNIFDAINAGRARSVGGGAESAKAMAIVLPAAAVCLLMVLGFVYWKFIRTPMNLDDEQPLDDDGGEAGDEGGDEPPAEEQAAAEDGE